MLFLFTFLLKQMEESQEKTNMKKNKQIEFVKKSIFFFCINKQKESSTKNKNKKK